MTLELPAETISVVTDRFGKEARTWRAFGWHACRDSWDLGIPIGSGNTEAEAIEDLLEREDNA